MAGVLRPTSAPGPMTLFYISIPVMLLGVAIAVLPVLVGSMRHDKSLNEGRLETPESAAQEADFWHHILGHHKVEEFAPTPDLIEDKDVLRVVSAERMIGADPTVWAILQQEELTGTRRPARLVG